MGMACRAIVVLSLVGLILLKIVIGIYLNVDPSIRHVTDSPQQNVMALDDSDDEIFIFVHVSNFSFKQAFILFYRQNWLNSPQSRLNIFPASYQFFCDTVVFEANIRKIFCTKISFISLTDF